MMVMVELMMFQELWSHSQVLSALLTTMLTTGVSFITSSGGKRKRLETERLKMPM